MMETIGKQVRLPISTALQIAMQGISIRLGRALVTISGVVLGIAFLMSIFTGNIITRAVAKEQTFQNKLKVMMTSAQEQPGHVRRENGRASQWSGITSATSNALS